jgi:addiction module HigA family antidote
MNKPNQQFDPDYIVTPGMVLEDYLEGLSMTQIQLSLRTGLTEKTISEIIKGKAPITHLTAHKFETALGRPAHFWNKLESDYQEDKIRFEEKYKLQQDIEWLNKFPINTMIKYKWMEKHIDKADQVNALLQFFGISTPSLWGDVWKNYQVIFRQEHGCNNTETELSVWLRRGEIEALEIPCAPYDKSAFRNILNEVRTLTIETEPTLFIPKLQEKCASAGVAIVFVPEIPKTRVHGATRWMKNKAIIQLSLRYKSNDHLWFTFFHEAAHILLHGRTDIFIECDKYKNEKENEADNFAQAFLVPPAELRNFISNSSNNRISSYAIQDFANSINIAPGIVVGRLQHDKVLSPSYCNELKIRYKWVNY